MNEFEYNMDGFEYTIDEFKYNASEFRYSLYITTPKSRVSPKKSLEYTKKKKQK